MIRTGVISDELRERIEPVLPADAGRRGRPWRDHRQILEAIAWRFRTGCPWRDVPAEFGPWQTLWKRHRRWSADGTYQAIFDRVLGGQAGAGALEWLVSADSTIARAHQHAAGCRLGTQGAGWNDKIPEPADHAIGRSRGGLTTKVHGLIDAGVRPLALLLSPGQAGDNPQLVPLLDHLARPPRTGHPLAAQDHRQGRACGTSHAIAQAPPFPVIFHGKTSAPIERDEGRAEVALKSYASRLA